jgi:hypothetical protein
VLELRTGIDAPRALGAAATARYLHIKLSAIARLEKRALRLLQRAASAHGCGPAARRSSGAFILGAAGPAGGLGLGGAAFGGVEAARYGRPPLTAPSDIGGKHSATGAGNSLGIAVPSSAEDPLLAVLIGLGGMLLIAVLVAGELGLGAQYRRRQHRWGRRPPR